VHKYSVSNSAKYAKHNKGEILMGRITISIPDHVLRKARVKQAARLKKENHHVSLSQIISECVNSCI